MGDPAGDEAHGGGLRHEHPAGGHRQGRHDAPRRRRERAQHAQHRNGHGQQHRAPRTDARDEAPGQGRDDHAQQIHAEDIGQVARTEMIGSGRQVQVDEGEQPHQREQDRESQHAGGPQRGIAQELPQGGEAAGKARIDGEMARCGQAAPHHPGAREVQRGHHAEGHAPVHVLGEMPHEEAPQETAQHGAGHIAGHDPHHRGPAELLADIGDQHHGYTGHGQPLEEAQDQEPLDGFHLRHQRRRHAKSKDRGYDQPFAAHRVGQHADERGNQGHGQHRHPHRVADLDHRGVQVLLQLRQDRLHGIDLEEGEHADQRHGQHQGDGQAIVIVGGRDRGRGGGRGTPRTRRQAGIGHERGRRQAVLYQAARLT